MAWHIQRITTTDSVTEIDFFLYYDYFLIFKELNWSKLCLSCSLWNFSVFRASMSESHPQRLWTASLLSTLLKGTKSLGKIPKVTEYHARKTDWVLCICWDVVLRNHWAVLGERTSFLFPIQTHTGTCSSSLFKKRYNYPVLFITTNLVFVRQQTEIPDHRNPLLKGIVGKNVADRLSSGYSKRPRKELVLWEPY